MELIASLDALEFVGLVLGLAAVLLLIRQSIWTWPVGLAYALISVWVFLNARLYADLLLHVFYVGMNLYGWWYWLNAKREPVGNPGPERADERHGGAETGGLPVTRSRVAQLLVLGAIGLLGSLCMGFYFATYTNADYAYADSATTAFSFVAMWMQARKLLESWVLWFVIDIGACALYTIKGLDFYAILYLVYLALAVIGWRAWRRTLIPQ